MPNGSVAYRFKCPACPEIFAGDKQAKVLAELRYHIKRVHIDGKDR